MFQIQVPQVFISQFFDTFKISSLAFRRSVRARKKGRNLKGVEKQQFSPFEVT
jgi:hypothetical protein